MSEKKISYVHQPVKEVINKLLFIYEYVVFIFINQPVNKLLISYDYLFNKVLFHNLIVTNS